MKKLVRLLTVAPLGFTALALIVPLSAASAQDVVSPVSGYLLTSPYPAVSTQPGSTVKLDLAAYAPTTEPVAITVTDAPADWTTVLRGGGFVISGATADPEDPAAIKLELEIPPDAAPGDYPVVIEEVGSTGTAELEMTITVAEIVDAGIGITADFPSLTGGPTDTFTYTLTVENNTPTDQTFNFTPRGPQGWEVTSSPTAQARANTVTIDAGSTSDVQVTATPPAAVEEGSYQIEVVVTAESGASGSLALGAEVIGTGTLVVSTANGRLDTEGSAGGESQETFILANTGSGPLDTVRFVATPPQGWDVTFSPETVDSVLPGDTAQVTATITPSNDAVAGDYVVSVRASAGSESQTLDLRYRVTTSSWLGFLGVGIIVVAIAGTAVGFRWLGRR